MLCGDAFYSAFQSVRTDGCNLQTIPNDLRDNKTIVLAAVLDNPSAIQWAGPRCRADPVVADVVFSGNVVSPIPLLYYMSKEIQANRILVLKACMQDAENLEFASEALKHDKGIVMAAVQKDGTSLSYASDRLKNDPDVAWAAVQQDGFALSSTGFKSDLKYIWEAVTNTPQAIVHVDDRVIEDNPHIVRHAIENSKDPSFFAKLPLSIRENPVIVRDAIKHDSEYLLYASDALRLDKDMFRHAMNHARGTKRRRKEDLFDDDSDDDAFDAF